MNGRERVRQIDRKKEGKEGGNERRGKERKGKERKGTERKEEERDFRVDDGTVSFPLLVSSFSLWF